MGLAAAELPSWRSNITLAAPARHHRRAPAITRVHHPSLLHQRWVLVAPHQALYPRLYSRSTTVAAAVFLSFGTSITLLRAAVPSSSESSDHDGDAASIPAAPAGGSSCLHRTPVVPRARGWSCEVAHREEGPVLV